MRGLGVRRGGRVRWRCARQSRAACGMPMRSPVRCSAWHRVCSEAHSGRASFEGRDQASLSSLANPKPGLCVGRVERAGMAAKRCLRAGSARAGRVVGIGDHVGRPGPGAGGRPARGLWVQAARRTGSSISASTTTSIRSRAAGGVTALPASRQCGCMVTSGVAASWAAVSASAVESARPRIDTQDTDPSWWLRGAYVLCAK